MGIAEYEELVRDASGYKPVEDRVIRKLANTNSGSEHDELAAQLAAMAHAREDVINRISDAVIKFRPSAPEFLAAIRVIAEDQRAAVAARPCAHREDEMFAVQQVYILTQRTLYERFSLTLQQMTAKMAAMMTADQAAASEALEAECNRLTAPHHPDGGGVASEVA